MIKATAKKLKVRAGGNGKNRCPDGFLDCNNETVQTVDQFQDTSVSFLFKGDSCRRRHVGMVIVRR